MAINLQDLITVLGGQGMFLGAAYFLFKAGIAHKFALDAKEFETQLKAKADVEIEQLKSSLQMIAYEQQVRFSKLHDRRAEVIAELYKRLVVDVFWVGQQFLSKGTFSNVAEERQAEFIETTIKFRDFSLFVDTNRIYLPEEICTLLDKFVDDVRKTVVGVAIYALFRFRTRKRIRNGWKLSLMHTKRLRRKFQQRERL
jgi:hypothetical protein